MSNNTSELDSALQGAVSKISACHLMDAVEICFHTFMHRQRERGEWWGGGESQTDREAGKGGGGDREGGETGRERERERV